MERFLDFIKHGDSKILGLCFGEAEEPLSTGQYIPRSEAALAPTISFSEASPATKYVVVCIDLDGPFPSFNILSPILHWIQSDLELDTSTHRRFALTTNEPFIANYVGPGPPPTSSPHRYVFFLYEQPGDLKSGDYAPPEGRELGLWPRMRWSLATWEKKAKVGKPVAMGYCTSN